MGADYTASALRNTLRGLSWKWMCTTYSKQPNLSETGLWMRSRIIPTFKTENQFVRLVECLFLLVLFVAQLSSSQETTDPFAFFQPSLTITASERAQLSSGHPFARVLETEGPEVGVFAVAPVSVDGDRLVAWERRIEEFKKSSQVLAIGRFSDPPRIEDLANLEL